ncbi:MULTISPECIES: GspH/FimT family pseudopilin [Synechococcales]|uniref:GspH/FimT family pseudopilin n=1 Tax=unclassified Synechococcus TaxID=2626047 RepID=UPI000DB4A33F|nr:MULTISPECIES: GspH/FimT family pseudopilin [unclassified Synechococcus]MCT0212083.1 GspH/FimT family pseudopilin [Synechococcus sp. CS-1326]MCT0234204.1 GspH/FimT family pseudopilin [Synechococcus sp. CS-1327]PZU98066.1 MAG: prepilin-type cleavage/methylation domain-containing protein [Cyanobium sp.]
MRPKGRRAGLPGRGRWGQEGSSLTEVLITVAVLGLLAGMAMQAGSESLARQRLEAATRRLAQGIERGRTEAAQRGEPCGLSLSEQGWQPPATGSLIACRATTLELAEGVESATVALNHNLPEVLRFSSNGLVLDGGTVVLASAGTALRRCLVMALPLGIVRLGRYGGSADGTPESELCQPDPSL